MVLNYAYDQTGALTNLWSSTGHGANVVYSYDALGRLYGVTANGAAVGAYGYDAVGNLQSSGYGNGVTNLYQYDARNRLTNLVSKLGTSARASYAYGLGPTGMRTNLAETVNGVSGSRAWSYDNLYRLTQEVLGGGVAGALSYRYDPVGNRTNLQSSLGLIASATNAYSANDWLANATYDADGNTTVSSTGAYSYDALDHLTNALGSSSVTITYDGDGNRVSKLVGTTLHRYLVDDRNPSGYAQVWYEADSGGGRVAYVYGLDLIRQAVTPAPGTNTATTYYYGRDGQGSIRYLTDTNGTVVDTYTYDAFGILVSGATSGILNHYRYTGQQWDEDLGMYYLRARYYQPTSGRFWTRDTDEGICEDPLSLHKYLYCGSDPVNRLDPRGTDYEMIGLIANMTIRVGLAAWNGYSAYRNVRSSALSGIRAYNAFRNGDYEDAYGFAISRYCQ